MLRIVGIVIGVIGLFVILSFGRETIIGMTAFWIVYFTVFFRLVLREKSWWRPAMAAATASVASAIVSSL